MAKTFNGVPASGGVAVAEAYLLVAPKFDIPNHKIKEDEVVRNMDLLQEGMQKAKAQLIAIRDRAHKKLGEKYAAIFDAHVELLADPSLHEAITYSIQKDLNNVLFAVNAEFDKTYNMFLSLDEPYFRERSADVADLKMRLLSVLTGKPLPDLMGISKEVILVADDLTPSQTSLLDKAYVKGFATNMGGATSHAAIIARNLEIPAVLGLKDVTEQVRHGETIAIDGAAGTVHCALDEGEIASFAKKQAESAIDWSQDEYAHKRAITLDKYEVIVCANIGKPEEMEKAVRYGARGVGLFRSEFLYMDASDWPSENEQYEAYKKVVAAASNELVVIRTLDIGGDKHLSYYKFDHEMNPFLGNRAIRLCLSKPEVFKTQLRALLRASYHGRVGIMFPMIATIEELLQAKRLLEECKKELADEKVIVGNPLVGIMIETPAAAVISDVLAREVDFFSVGTNDLIQYTFAADRMAEAIDYLYQPLNPGLIRLLKMTVSNARKYQVWTGMCGEMAGQLLAIPLLVGMGFKELSMSPSSMARAKRLICSLKKQECSYLVEKAVLCHSEKAVTELVKNFLEVRQIKI